MIVQNIPTCIYVCTYFLVLRNLWDNQRNFCTLLSTSLGARTRGLVVVLCVSTLLPHYNNISARIRIQNESSWSFIFLQEIQLLSQALPFSQSQRAPLYLVAPPSSHSYPDSPLLLAIISLGTSITDPFCQNLSCFKAGRNCHCPELSRHGFLVSTRFK